MWFRKKPKPLPIPPYKAPEPEKPVEPVEPMEVHEALDPTDSMIMRFKDLMKRKLKG